MFFSGAIPDGTLPGKLGTPEDESGRGSMYLLHHTRPGWIIRNHMNKTEKPMKLYYGASNSVFCYVPYGMDGGFGGRYVCIESTSAAVAKMKCNVFLDTLIQKIVFKINKTYNFWGDLNDVSAWQKTLLFYQHELKYERTTTFLHIKKRISTVTELAHWPNSIPRCKYVSVLLYVCTPICCLHSLKCKRIHQCCRCSRTTA